MDILKLLAGWVGWLATFNKANIAAAVGIASTYVLLPIFHVNLSAQDQVELAGVLAVLLHQAVYWLPNSNKVPTGDFGTASGSANSTAPPRATPDKGL